MTSTAIRCLLFEGSDDDARQVRDLLAGGPRAVVDRMSGAESEWGCLDERAVDLAVLVDGNPDRIERATEAIRDAAPGAYIVILCDTIERMRSQLSQGTEPLHRIARGPSARSELRRVVDRLLERRDAARRIESLRRLIGDFSVIHHLLAAETDTRRLARRMCGFLVELREYDAVWVAYRGPGASGTFVGRRADGTEQVEDMAAAGPWPLCSHQPGGDDQQPVRRRSRGACPVCPLRSSWCGENSVLLARVAARSPLRGAMAIVPRLDQVVEEEEEALLAGVASLLARAPHEKGSNAWPEVDRERLVSATIDIG